MPEVFKRSEMKFGGGFAAEKGLITPVKGLTGVLMQGLNVQHNRQMSRIYDIGQTGQPRSVFYVTGPTQGQIGVSHVMGPPVSLIAFYDNFSDVCAADTNTLQLTVDRGACVGSGASLFGQIANKQKVIYQAKFCVLNSVGFNLASGDLLINEQSRIDFTGLEIQEQ